MNGQWYDQMTTAERRAAGFWPCSECPWPTQEQIDAAYAKLSDTDKPIKTWQPNMNNSPTKTRIRKPKVIINIDHRKAPEVKQTEGFTLQAPTPEQIKQADELGKKLLEQYEHQTK
jgi:hypothetical protein